MNGPSPGTARVRQARVCAMSCSTSHPATLKAIDPARGEVSKYRPGNPQAPGSPLAEPIETKRRLAAIFAADVEGYSRLMGADEVGTLDALTARREILDGLIATRGGRIANTAGDSVLAEFGSAVDAVRCAMEAQRPWPRRTQPSPRPVPSASASGSMLVTSWSAPATCLVTGSTSQPDYRRLRKPVGSASPV